MGKILLVCPEPIRQRIQGVGIRFLEMAQELKRSGHEVSLWVPNDDIPKSRPEWIQPVWSPSFRRALRSCDAVVLHGHISELYFSVLEAEGLGDGPPLVVDLYDPFPIENLQYTSYLGDGLYERDRAVLVRQLQAGDFFLTSSAIQRLFYIGGLVGLGRLKPALYREDPSLHSWITVVPFGVRPIERQKLESLPGKIKGVLSGVNKDDVVVFFGGVYDWYDRMLVLEAAAPFIQAGCPMRIIFCENPNPDTTPQKRLLHVRRWADERGWMNRHVFVIPWFPYEDRFHYYRDVDIAVSLHCPSLETDLSLRTRLLDYMNAGLPIIATQGGEGSAKVVEAGAGVVIPPGNSTRLREALHGFLSDEGRRRLCGEQGRRWVQTHMRWDQSLHPLVRFCQAPRKCAIGAHPLTLQPSSSGENLIQLRSLIQELRRYRSTYGLGATVRRMWRLWGKGI
ncbi:MAG: glycosyltransferase [candidate division WOR-3 bacterium]